MGPIGTPATPRGDQVDDYQGTIVADPYRWLEHADSVETRAWVEQQNAHTESWIGAVPDRDRIRRRLAQLWDHPRRSAPWCRGERWFQLRNSGLEDQDVLWTMADPGGQGHVLLDPNALSGDGTVALTGAAVSADGTLLAYGLSEAGSDWMTWRVRSTTPGVADLSDELRWSKFSGAAWAPDGSGFFYARYDAPVSGEELAQANLGQRLWFHQVGAPQSADTLVYERPDQPEWGFDPTVTEDGRWLIIHVWQGTDHRNRVFVAELGGGTPGPAIQPLFDEFDAGYDFVGNVGSVGYFRTDRDAPRGRLIAVDLLDPAATLREVIPQGRTILERVVLVGRCLVAVELDDAKHRLQRFTLEGSNEGSITQPGIGTIEAVSGRQDDRSFYFTFTSFVAPLTVCRHDLDSGQTSIAFTPPVMLDQAAMETEQVFVTSTDGARVPMFLVRRADLPHPADGQPVEVPTLLYGYGGFGISVTPVFRVAWLVWLELGGQLAVANLRGGGEYGEEWHAAGRGDQKQRVFDDFVACAEALVSSGWTTNERLAITGGSNGGLLVGACLTQRPELYAACVAEVGVMDMLRFHRFTIGWAWVSEYGSSDDPAQLKTLLAYSPLHNLWPRTHYPATLLTTGDHDDRVVPGHSYKFAAALQAAQAGPGPILLRVQTDAGHGMGKPIRAQIEERADVLAFLVRTIQKETPHE